MNRRIERLNSLIKQEVALIVQRELSDPRLESLPTVTRVKVAQDLATADVYVASFGGGGRESAAIHALTQAAGHIRKRLMKTLDLRITPQLRFHADEQYRKEIEVLELLAQLEEERKAREADAPPAGQDAE